MSLIFKIGVLEGLGTCKKSIFTSVQAASPNLINTSSSGYKAAKTMPSLISGPLQEAMILQHGTGINGKRI
ncbi:hypothetical protein Sjap_008275 [Stephania japonica]|uniref:Uncharacterized protein n=1 Tax=Stephania japonica TaxID=461633 RepID=A0AAP0PEB0_9MAGN